MGAVQNAGVALENATGNEKLVEVLEAGVGTIVSVKDSRLLRTVTTQGMQLAHTVWQYIPSESGKKILVDPRLVGLIENTATSSKRMLCENRVVEWMSTKGGSPWGNVACESHTPPSHPVVCIIMMES